MSATVIGAPHTGAPLTVVPEARLTDKVKFLKALSAKNNTTETPRIAKVKAMGSSVVSMFRFAMSWVAKFATTSRWWRAGFISALSSPKMYNAAIKAGAWVAGVPLSIIRRLVVGIGHAYDGIASGAIWFLGLFKSQKQRAQNIINRMCDATDKRMARIDKMTDAVRSFRDKIVEMATVKVAGKTAAVIGTVAGLFLTIDALFKGVMTAAMSASTHTIVLTTAGVLSSVLSMAAIIIGAGLLAAAINATPWKKMFYPVVKPIQRTIKREKVVATVVESATDGIEVVVENAATKTEAAQVANTQVQETIAALENVVIKRVQTPRAKRRR